MKKLVAAIGLLFLAVSANATPITWTLNNVELSTDVGVGSLSGTFDYDAEFNLYSNIDIVSSDWTVDFDNLFLSGSINDFVGGTPRSISANGFASSSPTNTLLLTLNFNTALTGAGGDIMVGYSDLTTSAGGIFYNAYDGTGSVSAVPIPAAVWLFGSGLGLLGFARRKRA